MFGGDAIPADTEDSLALSFAELHIDELRYVQDTGQWLGWDGTRWRPDRTSRAYEMVRKHIRTFASSINFAERRKIANAKTVAAVEHMARKDPRIVTEAATWDANIWLLNTPSGTVDLQTGILHPACPSDHMTKITAVGPGGECPTWLAFLHRAMNGDAELIAFLQRALGYALCGSTRDHAFFFLHGPGGKGKGVFLNTIAGILGDYSTTAPIETFLASQFDRHPTDVAALAGARLAVSDEIPPGRYWDEAKLNRLTGGDTIRARFMRQDGFEFVPQFKLVLVGNNRPRLHTVNEAIRRRLNLIPFTVRSNPPVRAAFRATTLPAIVC
jgi:putative DNA primase/helicase